MPDHAQPDAPNTVPCDQPSGGNEASLLYQPTLSCISGKVVHFDVTLEKADRAAAPPAPERLIDAVCQQLAQWRADTGVEVGVSVNVDRDALEHGLLLQPLRAALETHGIAPDKLQLTFSESDPIADVERMQEALTALKGLGVRLALEDFGNGSTGLAHLVRLPLDGLKLAPELIKSLADHADARLIVRTILSMAHRLNLSVAATGVQSQEQLTRLLRKGCDEVQGPLFAPPLSPQAAMDFLRRQGAADDLPWRGQLASRTLLIVDDEQNILSSLRRLFRGDGYRILTAESAEHGLKLLTEQSVDVILSDQRMPGMSGVEFLRQVKIAYPDTVRLVLSGYTDLQSVTDAINEGAIYKFLTKPWDDGILRANIEEAFRRKEMLDENKRLQRELHAANRELALANETLSKLLDEGSQKLKRGQTSLSVLQEILQDLPWPVLGIDDEQAIAFSNSAALALLPDALIGTPMTSALPQVVLESLDVSLNAARAVQIDTRSYHLRTHRMGSQSNSSGRLVLLLPSVLNLA